MKFFLKVCWRLEHIFLRRTFGREHWTFGAATNVETYFYDLGDKIKSLPLLQQLQRLRWSFPWLLVAISSYVTHSRKVYRRCGDESLEDSLRQRSVKSHAVKGVTTLSHMHVQRINMAATSLISSTLHSVVAISWSRHWLNRCALHHRCNKH